MGCLCVWTSVRLPHQVHPLLLLRQDSLTYGCTNNIIIMHPHLKHKTGHFAAMWNFAGVSLILICFIHLGLLYIVMHVLVKMFSLAFSHQSLDNETLADIVAIKHNQWVIYSLFLAFSIVAPGSEK